MTPLGAALAAGAVIWIVGLGTPALAEPSRCFENGDIVAFDGIASAGATRSHWLLNLSRPICVTSATSSAGLRISAVRIIGTPPPPGIPLELVGKLMLRRTAGQPAVFAALVVSRGRKLRTTENLAPAPRSAPVRRRASSAMAASRLPVAPAPQSAPVSREVGNCNAPPYGGSRADYHAFVQRFGHIVKPDKILADVCNAKFGKAPRDQLHRLGLTDAKINSEDTEQLAEETIVALKNLVNKLE